MNSVSTSICRHRSLTTSTSRILSTRGSYTRRRYDFRRRPRELGSKCRPPAHAVLMCVWKSFAQEPTVIARIMYLTVLTTHRGRICAGWTASEDLEIAMVLRFGGWIQPNLAQRLMRTSFLPIGCPLSQRRVDVAILLRSWLIASDHGILDAGADSPSTSMKWNVQMPFPTR